MPALHRLAAAALLARAAAAAAADPGRPFLAADVGAYLAGADMLWSWSAAGGAPLDPLAPTRWFQGAYVGNGLVGAMVTAVVDPLTNATTALRADVARTDVWACAQRAATGFLTLRALAAPLARVDMRLELFSARLRVNLTLATGARVAFSLLVAAADPLGPTGLLALRVEGGAGAGAPLGVDFTPDSSSPCSDRAPAARSVPSAWGRPTNSSTQTFAAGTVTAAWTDFTARDGAQALLLALANSQRAADAGASLGDARAGVAAGVALGLDALEAAHAAWWASFWRDTSFFSFDSAGGLPGVTKLEQFAHIAGYRYASAARFTMHDLMGPWGPSHATTCIGPWCQFCWDMNQQVMMYLPGPSNRGALLARPAFDMLPALLDGSWAARYGSNAPGDAGDVLWWTAQAWRHCLLHGDDARLVASVLPALRRFLAAARLTNGTDGLLHVAACKSPEYPMSAATDCNYDLSIFRWAAQTGRALAEALAPGDAGLPLFRDVERRLAPFPVDPATGSFMVAAGVPFAVPHRHYSHLLMMHDLELLSAANASVAGASLDLWWRVTCAEPQARWPDWPAGADVECRGFTQAAMAQMSNALSRSEAALGNLTSYLRLVGLPNAMYGEEVYAGHPDEFSPVAESAYAAAAAVYGALVRASPLRAGAPSGAAAAAEPLVHLWPAGGAFANASFFRLRVAGALLVSAVRARGAAAWAAVEADVLADGSGAGAPVAFVLFASEWAALPALGVAGAPGVTAARVAPGAFAVAGLVRGAAAAFFPPGAAPPDFGVGVAEGRNASEANAWGSRFVYDGILA